jgi:hypothetical protein
VSLFRKQQDIGVNKMRMVGADWFALMFAPEESFVYHDGKVAEMVEAVESNDESPIIVSVVPGNQLRFRPNPEFWKANVMEKAAYSTPVVIRGVDRGESFVIKLEIDLLLLPQ